MSDEDTFIKNEVADAKRVLFVGSYGVGNLGDEAILSVLMDELPRDTRVRVLSRSPEHSSELHGVKAVQAVSPAALLEVARADAVVLGGGGIFSGLAGRLTDALPAFLRVTQRAGKPLHVVGLGIYPDTPRPTLERTLAVLRNAASVSVRDATSFALLKRHGVPCRRIPDPATRLQPASADEARRVLESEGVPVDEPLVGVSPRRVRNARHQDALTRELPVALRTLQERGHSLVFLPTAHFRFGDFTNDLHYSRELARDLDPDRTFVVHGLHHPRLACALFGVPRAHLTMRLHALIFAWRMGRPAVPLSYAEKVADVAKELDAPALDLDTLKADAMVDAVERTLAGQ